MSVWARICVLAFLLFAGSVQAQSLTENGIQQVVQAADIDKPAQIAGVDLSGWDTLAAQNLLDGVTSFRMRLGPMPTG